MDTVVGTNKKLVPKYRGPYVIIKKLGNDRYVVEDVDNYRVTQQPYHGVLDSSRIKRWVDPKLSLTAEQRRTEAEAALPI